MWSGHFRKHPQNGERPRPWAKSELATYLLCFILLWSAPPCSALRHASIRSALLSFANLLALFGCMNCYVLLHFALSHKRTYVRNHLPSISLSHAKQALIHTQPRLIQEKQHLRSPQLPAYCHGHRYCLLSLPAYVSQLPTATVNRKQNM